MQSVPEELTPMRLTVGADAADKPSLLALLEEQAREFFGDEGFRLEGDVDVDVETVVTVAGKVEAVRYGGRAVYVNWKPQG